MHSGHDIGEYLNEILETAKNKGLETGFVIGSTVKAAGKSNFYTTPIRNAGTMIIGGVVVYKEQEAIGITRQIDGRVDYVLVDAEKKIPHQDSDFGDIPNIERRVREQIRHSKLWVFKGNDITVDAVDALISYLCKDNITGVGGKKVAILGAGNIGTKLALKFVERGANVVITRRDTRKLKKITEALNLIKSPNTISKVVGMTDNVKASNKADVLIGSTNGLPVISRKILEFLADDPIIIDVGKGTLFHDAIDFSKKSGLVVYRLDVTAALFGLIETLTMTDQIISKKMGRRKVDDLFIVSGGLFAHKGEVVVDNFELPRRLYGIANGEGDFEENVSLDRLNAIKKILSLEGEH